MSGSTFYSISPYAMSGVNAMITIFSYICTFLNNLKQMLKYIVCKNSTCGVKNANVFGHNNYFKNHNIGAGFNFMAIKLQSVQTKTNPARPYSYLFSFFSF
jgi:hypothetical protein